MPEPTGRAPRLDPDGVDTRIAAAIADIAAGRPVIVVDGEERENEGDLIYAGALATPELLAFTIRHTSGVVCAPMAGRLLDELRIPLMTQYNNERMRTAFTVTVDAAAGVTTGISAADRARTIRVLADPGSQAGDLVRPGHVFPLRARDGGVLARPGHTEAALDLMRAAGLPQVGVIAELVDDDGTMKRGAQLAAFGAAHGIRVIKIADLITYRRRTESQVERVAVADLPTDAGFFRTYGFRDVVTGLEHVALVTGDLGGTSPVLARLHSECLTGDVFASQRCDCGPQLRAALAAVAVAGRGVVVYIRGHEGRGIGLSSKLAAYALQDAGRDTVDANLDLGFPVDARSYVVGAQILRDLGVGTVRLLTNNPAKVEGLRRYGVPVVERVPLTTSATEHNVRYLATKRDRMGHHLEDLLSGLGQTP
jgi:3,4-dihydroxy 2-butanone 4-phosphate synthase / GTP cyclohydrolase II